MRIALCLLTLNELAGCKENVPAIKLDEFDEVFAVDGGSRDGTIDYLESRGILVHQQDIKGYNGAYITAFRRCTADALVFYHPKGTIDPTEILNFRRYLEAGYDLVVASRIIKGAYNEEDDKLLKPRKWFVIGLGLLSSMVWKRKGNTVWDVLHGFRAMKKQAFFAIDPLDKGLSIDLEMVVRAYRNQLKCIEFPIRELPRQNGETHFKAFSTGKKLLRYLVYEFFRKNETNKQMPDLVKERV